MSSACADELRLSYLRLSVKTVAWRIYRGKGGGIGCNYASATGAYILAEKYGSGLEISLRGSEISFKFLQTCTTRTWSPPPMHPTTHHAPAHPLANHDLHAVDLLLDRTSIKQLPLALHKLKCMQTHAQTHECTRTETETYAYTE